MSMLSYPTVTAQYRNARISPYKARLVANALCGMMVQDAAVALQFSPLKGAFLFRKLLLSAIANAENNHGVDNIDEYCISNIWANEGSRMKRLRPRARGRANRIVKRNSHLSIEVRYRMDRH